MIGTIVLPPSPSDLRRVQNRIRHDSDKVTFPTKPYKSRFRQDAKKAMLLFPYASMWWSLFDIGRKLGLAGNVSRRLVCSLLTAVRFSEADGITARFRPTLNMCYGWRHIILRL